MRRVLQTHGPAVARSGWGRSVEKGIFEFRLRMNGKEIVNLEAELHGVSEDEARDRFGLNPSEDVLLRVFCTTRAALSSCSCTPTTRARTPASAGSKPKSERLAGG